MLAADTRLSEAIFARYMNFGYIDGEAVPRLLLIPQEAEQEPASTLTVQDVWNIQNYIQQNTLLQLNFSLHFLQQALSRAAAPAIEKALQVLTRREREPQATAQRPEDRTGTRQPSWEPAARQPLIPLAAAQPVTDVGGPPPIPQAPASRLPLAGPRQTQQPRERQAQTQPTQAVDLPGRSPAPVGRQPVYLQPPAAGPSPGVERLMGSPPMSRSTPSVREKTPSPTQRPPIDRQAPTQGRTNERAPA